MSALSHGHGTSFCPLIPPLLLAGMPALTCCLLEESDWLSPEPSNFQETQKSERKTAPGSCPEVRADHVGPAPLPGLALQRAFVQHRLRASLTH